MFCNISGLAWLPLNYGGYYYLLTNQVYYTVYRKSTFYELYRKSVNDYAFVYAAMLVLLHFTNLNLIVTFLTLISPIFLVCVILKIHYL